MDQDTARRLFAEGAILMLDGVPQGTEFGMDYTVWEVGPRFRGIKMIPPGLHFVFYSATSTGGQRAPRTGFFHVFKAKEIMVKWWDSRAEDVSDDAADQETVERVRLDLPNLDRCLGPYPFDQFRHWMSLTNHVSEQLLKRLQPEKCKISAVMQFQPQEFRSTRTQATSSDSSHMDTSDCHLATSSSSSPSRHAVAGAGGDEDQDGLPNLQPVPGTALRLTPFPKHNYPPGSSPAQMTHHSLDRSYVFNKFLQSYQETTDLVGELQFAFVCFLVGHVYDAFEQWKKLVVLFCSCEEALATHPKLFSSFIATLHFQLKDVREDFFVDIVSQHNFLAVSLQRFFDTIEENSGSLDQQLVRRGRQFRAHLTEKYNWDLSGEPDEDAPTVVET